MCFMQFLEQAAVILLYNIDKWKVLKFDAGEVWRNKLIDRIRNKEVLQRVKGDGNILQTIKSKTPNCIVYILRRNCHLRHVTEGMIKRGI